MEDRIKKLNDKLWDFSFPRGTTRLYEADFTERERKVFALFEEIMEKYSPQVPPLDVLSRMNPLFDAMQRIWIHRAVDLFVHIAGPIIFMGWDEQREKQELVLLEMQLWNFIFRRARDRNEEDAWDNAVCEVFGHNNLDLLPDTEAEPLDPGWAKVDAIMEEYCVNRDQREEKEERQLMKDMRGKS